MVSQFLSVFLPHIVMENLLNLLRKKTLSLPSCSVKIEWTIWGKQGKMKGSKSNESYIAQRVGSPDHTASCRYAQTYMRWGQEFMTWVGEEPNLSWSKETRTCGWKTCLMSSCPACDKDQCMIQTPRTSWGMFCYCLVHI